MGHRQPLVRPLLLVEVRHMTATSTRAASASPSVPFPVGSLGGDSMDELYSRKPDCPHGGVEEVMRTGDLLKCSPDESLTAVIPRLSQVRQVPWGRGWDMPLGCTTPLCPQP